MLSIRASLKFCSLVRDLNDPQQKGQSESCVEKGKQQILPFPQCL